MGKAPVLRKNYIFQLWQVIKANEFDTDHKDVYIGLDQLN